MMDGHGKPICAPMRVMTDAGMWLLTTDSMKLQLRAVVTAGTLQQSRGTPVLAGAGSR